MTRLERLPLISPGVIFIVMVVRLGDVYRMSEIKQCPNCRNMQASGMFCSQCGASLKVQVKTRMEAHVLLPSTLLILLGWMIIVVGLWGAWGIYDEVRTWGTVETVETTMPVVNNAVYSSDGLLLGSVLASVIGVSSLSMGGLLIGTGKIMSMIAALHDEVNATK